ncbi:MAG: iron chaperone [Anaerolineaceae bacterium]
MSAPRFTSVEDYFGSQDPTKAKTLRAIFDLVLGEFPQLAPKIAWNVPQIQRNGMYIVGVAAYKHHLTYAPWSTKVIEDFEARLEKYIVFKNCFQIPVDWEIDEELIKDLVKARLAELDGELPQQQ